jgi:hypothetical protein
METPSDRRDGAGDGRAYTIQFSARTGEAAADFTRM